VHDSEPDNTPVTQTTSRKIVFFTLLLLVFFVVTIAAWLATYFLTPAGNKAEKEATVIIPQGSSVKQIAGILEQAGLVNADLRFMIIARVSGLAGKLPAGEFNLPTGQLPYTLLQALAEAKPVIHAITIPEGWNRSEIAAALEQNGWCGGDEFLKLTENKEFLQAAGLGELENLEGYLFPDTYFLTRNEFQVERIALLFLDRFKQVWQELLKDEQEEVDQQKIVILASIVEKETGSAGERAKIAGVFLNRLQLGMKLQSDPTVIYGIDNFIGPITRQQLQTPTPYNTYIIPDLPKGPICSPGRDALEAVLHPEIHKYLYFVSQNDGTHYFSKSLLEHNRAVQKYQRKNSAKEGK